MTGLQNNIANDAQLIGLNYYSACVCKPNGRSFLPWDLSLGLRAFVY